MYYFVDRIKKENKKIPELFNVLKKEDLKTFYIFFDGRKCYFDIQTKSYKPVKIHSKHLG